MCNDRLVSPSRPDAATMSGAPAKPSRAAAYIAALYLGFVIAAPFIVREAGSMIPTPLSLGCAATHDVASAHPSTALISAALTGRGF